MTILTIFGRFITLRAMETLRIFFIFKRSLRDLLDTSSPSNAFQLNSNVSYQRGFMGVADCCWIQFTKHRLSGSFQLKICKIIYNVAAFLLSAFSLDGLFQHCIDRLCSSNASFISILARLRLYTFSKWSSTWIWFHYRYVQIYFIWNVMWADQYSLAKNLE